MNAADRLVVGAIAFMYATIPLYGTFAVFEADRPPIPPLLEAGAASAIAVSMLIAAAICVWGAVRRPAPRRLVAAQIAAGAAIVPAAILGFDPPTGFGLAALVLGQGSVAVAVFGYAGLPGATRAIVLATLGSAGTAIVLALAMLATRHPAPIFAYNNGRAIGTFLNPNEFAAYLLVVVALAAGVALAGPGRGLRRLAAAVGVLGLVALGLTFSRWGFLAAVAGLAFFAVVQRDRRVWAALGLAAVAAAAISFGPGSGHHNPRDDTSRVVAWTTGLRTFASFPLTGVGPFAFHRTYEALRPPEAPDAQAAVAYDPHSLPLAFLSESGLIGFGALLFGWWIYVAEIRRALRTAGRPQRILALALAAGLVALNVHVLVNTISIYFPLATQGAALVLAFAQRGIDAPSA